MQFLKSFSVTHQFGSLTYICLGEHSSRTQLYVRKVYIINLWSTNKTTNQTYKQKTFPHLTRTLQMPFNFPSALALPDVRLLSYLYDHFVFCRMSDNNARILTTGISLRPYSRISSRVTSFYQSLLWLWMRLISIISMQMLNRLQPVLW